MNSSNDATAGFAMQPGLFPFGRLFYWSVRREVWEYRSIYLVPLAMGGLGIFGFLFALPSLLRAMQATGMDPTQRQDALLQPFHVTAALVLGGAFILSIFYSVDALYGERRDRSVLFWKSLPVSDMTTVLAKASIPLVVLPIVGFVLTLVTEAIVFAVSGAVLAANGVSVATLWAVLAPFESLYGLLYHLITVHILWYAPLYAWLLLVSAWSRRAPFLWAALPVFAIGFLEKITFHSMHFFSFLEDRVGGGREAVNNMPDGMPMGPGVHLTPWPFLASPGLWIGLLVTALFLVAAARLRRDRQPG
jgi:ABC-2 type transport system permease protein